MAVMDWAEAERIDWDERARTEQTSWGAAAWSEHGQSVRFAAVRAHLDVRPGESVLDYGCGTGRFSEYLPYGVTYYGVDTSDEMILRASREHGGEDRWFGSCRNAFAMPHVTHVVAIGCFNAIPDWAAIRRLPRLASRTCVLSLHRDRFRLGEIADELALGGRSFLIDGTHMPTDYLVVIRP